MHKGAHTYIPDWGRRLHLICGCSSSVLIRSSFLSSRILKHFQMLLFPSLRSREEGIMVTIFPLPLSWLSEVATEVERLLLLSEVRGRVGEGGGEEGVLEACPSLKRVSTCGGLAAASVVICWV